MRTTKFQTLVDLPEFKWRCNYSSSSVFLGSCFTENVGQVMKDLKYSVDVNPYGILYNPMSVGNCITSLLSEKQFSESDLIFQNGLWHSFSHHGKFSVADSAKVLEDINRQKEESSLNIRNADFLFLTFGTAWVYRYSKSGDIVSNCHKIPSKDFTRERLSVTSIVEFYKELLTKLWQENPKLKIVFTVSPIRHWKDGAVENQRSKSTLILAVDELIRIFGEEKCAYFPSYEIVMDELRDYRFYTEDMLHINEVAVKHIWQIFEDVLIDDESKAVSLEVKKIINAANHRPFNKNTPEHLKFLRKYLELSRNLEAKHLNINLKLEKDYFASEIKKNESSTLDSRYKSRTFALNVRGPEHDLTIPIFFSPNSIIMHYLEFDREQLINLEYSLFREILRTNKAGSYLSTTLNGCNTRKYHGLLVSPIENFGGEKHVLLSSLDETVIQNEAEFNLGIHRYQGGNYEPKGHKYIKNLEFSNVPKTTYRVGGVVLTRERLLSEKDEQVLIRYTLEEAHSPTTLRLKPFLAFRNIHSLSKANMFVNTKYNKVENGISMKLYEGYPYLNMQMSKSADFVLVPDWYYNIEYLKELHRGYEYLEDLYVPGYFEFSIKKGESVVFAAGLKETKTVSLKQRFTREVNKREGKETFNSAIEHAARQFIAHKKNTVDIIAGFPWYGSITRQTFIALPGLCHSINDKKLCAKILDSYLKYFNDGFFPDKINENELTYHSADSSLWFIWVVQHYLKKNGDHKMIWQEYGPAIKRILNAYKDSTLEYIGMNKDGLIEASKKDTALTWMDSNLGDNPVIQRGGLAVEVNALWFNAICFAIDLADMTGDEEFIDEWKEMVEKVGKAFLNTFWSDEHGYLADVVSDGQVDWAVRPNMVIAAALDYSPLSKEQKKQILSVTKRKLLTNRGLRTLSPDHLRYKGLIDGNAHERESVVHLGAIWPWLIQFFVEGYLRIHKRGGLPFIKQTMESFEEEITQHCVGTVSEFYDGNPPHMGKGAISQAWNVAGVSYALNLIRNYNE